jgi:hypothetical protein
MTKTSLPLSGNTPIYQARCPYLIVGANVENEVLVSLRLER